MFQRLPRVAMVCAVFLTACANPSAPPAPPVGGASQGQTASGPFQERTGNKAVTIGVTAGVQVMGIMGSGTTSGGWQSMNELHSNGLVTSDVNDRRPVGRLAAQVPSLSDGSISVLNDGRMRVVYTLRRDITWQDGASFTARDLVFSFRVNSDKGLPAAQRDVIDRIETAEAPDDHTFILMFKGPYYLGGTLGIRPFWPQPEHLLGPAYERYLESKNPEDVMNLPYWTSEYVHLGPFRLASFDPAEGITLQAHPQYFLGRPKVDTVRVRFFSDHNTMMTNLLSGTVDMFPDSALNAEVAFQLKDRWESTGQGKVTVRQGITWFLAPQWRPNVQIETAVLDVRVRAAMYRALDREALSEGLQGGHRELAAWSLMPPGDQFHESTKDVLRAYGYDPERARAELRDLGWTPSPDGTLRNGTDGRRFRTALSTVPGRDREIAAMASYWRAIGLEVDEAVVPAARVRDLEFRAQFPGWDSTSSGSGDSIFGRLDDTAASAATRWVGERGGYENARAQELISRYRTSLSERDQADAMRAISDFVVAELPLLPLYYIAETIGVRTGVQALDDLNGGAEGSRPFGTYTRNAHLWDVR